MNGKAPAWYRVSAVKWFLITWVPPAGCGPSQPSESTWQKQLEGEAVFPG